ncbi:Imm61 family immunity protein [Leifsonia xyli]|uniref:Imm61 family immunity protein n=1 Tax=Leifsonia xyli TaxID=1575 RepID=UPI003D671A02
MSTTAIDIQEMVERVNAVAIPAGFGGAFCERYDAWMFADIGCEIRNFLRIVDGRLVLSDAQRGHTEEDLLFSTPLLTDMEKFLTFYFCNSLRGRSRLPRLSLVSIPVTKDKVAAEFSIEELDESPWYQLRHRDKALVRCGDDVELVKFSHYVDLSPEEIRVSALDPGGEPHFMVMGRPGLPPAASEAARERRCPRTNPRSSRRSFWRRWR